MKSASSLANDLNLSSQQIDHAIENGLSRISILKGSEDTYLIPKPRLKDLKKEILKVISDYHIVNYLKEIYLLGRVGLEVLEIVLLKIH